MDKLMAVQRNLIPLTQAGDAQDTDLARVRRTPVAICGLGAVALLALPGVCGS